MNPTQKEGTVTTPKHEHPDARWYRSAYRSGWLAFVNGEPMPRAEHALHDAGLEAGWKAAQAKYQHDAIATAYQPPDEP